MYSWVCASTPVVTRTITLGARAELGGQRAPAGSISSNESTMIRPTPGLERPAQLGDALVVAVQADPRSGATPAAQRDGELAAGADVEAEALLRDPARHAGAQERLCRRSRRPSRRRRRANARARARKSCLVDHVGRGADLVRRSVTPRSGRDLQRRPHRCVTPAAPQLPGQGIDVVGQPPASRGRRGRVGMDRAGDVHVRHGRQLCQNGARRTANSRRLGLGRPRVDPHVGGHVGQSQRARVGDLAAVRGHRHDATGRTQAAGVEPDAPQGEELAEGHGVGAAALQPDRPSLNASKISKLYKDYLKLEGFHKLVSLYEEINDNLGLFLKLYYAIIQNGIKPNEIVNLVKNSNELANLNTVIQMKKKELYFIEEKMKQYQAQMIMNNYSGYL